MEKIEFEGTVSETLLINLYFRSKENQETTPILKDEFSGDVVSKIDYDFAKFDRSTLSRVGTVIRARFFDDCILKFTREHPAAVIGRNCNISTGVTIGMIPVGRRAGAPRIGDRVWIGTNAVIVGGIEIGDDVLIAPGAFVNVDVPAPSAKLSELGNPGFIPDYLDALVAACLVMGACAGADRRLLNVLRSGTASTDSIESLST